MGLEPLLDSDSKPAKKAELRRFASESRTSRDLLQYRFINNNNFFFHLRQTQQGNSHSNIPSNAIQDNVANKTYSFADRKVGSKEYGMLNVRSGMARTAIYRGMGQRKSFFDSIDFFPWSKQRITIYGEIEKRMKMKMRGIKEPSQDLETLKHILEALQLKGLLHSKNACQLNESEESERERD